jgi:hypothetical protein
VGRLSSRMNLSSLLFLDRLVDSLTPWLRISGCLGSVRANLCCVEARVPDAGHSLDGLGDNGLGYFNGVCKTEEAGAGG